MTTMPLPPLRYMETGTSAAPFNLAVEEALTDSLTPDDPGIFMLWRNAPSVIIGRHQNARSEVNLPELARRDIRLVRRLTGGGAVYHDLGNVNFTFILPEKNGVGEADYSAARILAPLIRYLTDLGLDARMEGRNDLTVRQGGRGEARGKFSGLAGRRLPGKYLLHGTILYDVDFSVLEQALLVDPEKYRSKGVASVRARVINLKNVLPPAVPDLATLWAGMRDAYAAPAQPLPEAVIRRAEQLVEERYGSDDWNIGASPPGDITLKRRFPFGALELRLATAKDRITRACITGDFLSPNTGPDPAQTDTPANVLASALIDLPAGDGSSWAAAWEPFDLSRAFLGAEGHKEAVLAWLRDINTALPGSL